MVQQPVGCTSCSGGRWLLDVTAVLWFCNPSDQEQTSGPISVDFLAFKKQSVKTGSSWPKINSLCWMEKSCQCSARHWVGSSGSLLLRQDCFCSLGCPQGSLMSHFLFVLLPRRLHCFIHNNPVTCDPADMPPQHYHGNRAGNLKLPFHF